MIKSIKKVAVVILNFNGENYLKKFLPSVFNYTNKNICEIFIIDNHSSDNSIKFLNNNYPKIKIIRHKKNYGFAKGYNKGLKNINSEYFVLLNNDVEVTKNWLEPMLNKMEKNHFIGTCQPKILSYNEKNKFEHAGACGGYLDFLGYPFCRGRIFDHTEEDKGQYDDDQETFWSSGSCFMIRNQLFKNIGGFDEEFFAHMEEIDLCWRLRKEGYMNYCFPNSIVYHLGGGTLSYETSKKAYLNFRNNLIMITKNEKRIYLLLKLPLRFILDFTASLRFLIFKKSFMSFLSIIRAYIYLIINFPKYIINKRKDIGNRSLIRNKIIPVEYFLKGKKRFSDL